MTYHRPAAALRGAIASYYFVRVSGPGEVTDQIFPEWANFRLILSGRWTATFPGADPAPVPPSGVTGALERAVWVTGTEGLLAGGEHEVDSQQVLERARDSDCSAYDCEFVVLAAQLSTMLVTMDARLLKAFPKVARPLRTL